MDSFTFIYYKSHNWYKSSEQSTCNVVSMGQCRNCCPALYAHTHQQSQHASIAYSLHNKSFFTFFSIYGHRFQTQTTHGLHWETPIILHRLKKSFDATTHKYKCTINII